MAKLKKLGDKSHIVDVQIAAGMVCVALLSQQGLQSMQQVLQGAKDPVQAIAHVIFLAIGKVKQALHTKGIDIDARVWIAGGGVLDRCLFEIMMALATALKFQPAADSKFVAAVKSAVLDLMEDDDQNSKSIKVLHDKGLPFPKTQPQQMQGGSAAGGGQGLAAPQGRPQGGPPQQPQTPNGAQQ